MQDPKSRQKSPSGHHGATLSGYIFATKAHIDNRKKNLLSSNMFSGCPHNMVNIGLLTAEIDWRVWGTPSYFSEYRVLAALLHDSQVVGFSQTLQRWTAGATYVLQGDHHVGHWPTFLFFLLLLLSCFSFLAKSQRSQIECLPYFNTWWFYTWCGRIVLT